MKACAVTFHEAATLIGNLLAVGRQRRVVTSCALTVGEVGDSLLLMQEGGKFSLFKAS